MKKSLFLGVDVGSQEHVCALINKDREILWEGRIENSYAGCEELVKLVKTYLKKDYEIWVGAEGVGGYASPMDLILCATGCFYINANPVQVKRYRDLANWQPDKTDELDARLLADYAQWCVERNEAKAFQPQDSYFSGLKHIARATQQIGETKVKMQNELVSTVRTVWPELIQGDSFFSRTDSIGFLSLLSRYPTPHAVKKAGLARIKKLLLKACQRNMDEKAEAIFQSARTIVQQTPENMGLAEAVRSLAQTVLRLVEANKELVKRLEDHLTKHPFGKWLLDQKGIGPRNAGSVLGEAGDLSRFAGESQLARYSGNGATVSQSGKSKPKYYDCRRYNHRLKRSMILMAQTRSQHHGPSKEFIKKRLAQGIEYWKAMKQLARHLIRFLCKNWGKVMDNMLVEHSENVAFS